MIPTLAKLKESANQRCSYFGNITSCGLTSFHRTLSPSDFGFHNAIRRSDDVLIFIDFEYFGWDDPAKTISDFLLHPAMQLNEEHSQMFLSNCTNVFSTTDENLSKRITSKTKVFLLHGDMDVVVPSSNLLDAKDFLLRNKIEVDTKMIKNCDHHIPVEASSLALNYIKKNFKI